MSVRQLDAKEQALWMLHRLVPDSGVNNVPVAVSTPLRLDEAAVRRALRLLARRHRALWTVFAEAGGAPVARVAASGDLELVCFRSDRDRLPAHLTGFSREPIDVTSRFPVRVAHVHCPDSDVVCFVVHHLAVDAVSASVLMHDFVPLYLACAAGAEPPEPVPERAGEAPGPPAPASVAYWREHLRGARPPVALAFSRPEPDSEPDFTGGIVEHRLAAEAVDAVRRLSVEHRATGNVVLLAVYYLLLSRHGAGDDLVVGVPVDLREGAARQVVGYRMNTLPLRVPVAGHASFREFLGQMRRKFFDALGYADVSYEACVPRLGGQETPWWVPPFRYMFNYRPPAGPGWDPGFPGEVIDVASGVSRLDLELIVTADRHGPNAVHAAYRDAVVDRADAAALLARFESTLREVARDPDQLLSDIDIRSPRDRLVVARANQSARAIRPPVLDAVREQVRQVPERVAVDGTGGEITYRQLWERATAVRAALARQAVGAGDVIALHADRCADLAAATLGVWLVGAAYLPLDPDQPARRLRFMLEDAGAALVLTDRDLPGELAGRWPTLGLAQVARAADGAGDPPAAEPPAAPAAADRAYVIYTSGSTGRPKGVELSHGNLANVVWHFLDELAVGPGDRMLWLTSFGFDISALEVFLPLVAGARTVVGPAQARRDGSHLLATLRRYRATVVQATPTTWRLLPPDDAGALAGCRVLCGGEPLPRSLAQRLMGAGCQLWNVYGPTETTIWSTTGECGPERTTIDVGVPLANTTVRVVDRHGHAQPPGLPGEVYIAGAGVGIGYLGDPVRTARQFPAVAGERYYRTGDVGRWRHDGTLELFGRADRQIKLRGHRIELAEVEAVLEEHPAIGTAAVIVRREGEDQLVALTYPDQAEAGGAGGPPPAGVWEFVRERLPPYAVPGDILMVAEPFPTTANGKRDYQSLARRVSQEYASRRRKTTAGPEQQITRRCVELWRELLERPGLNEESNFFHEGGSSLLAAQLADRLSSIIGVPVPMVAVFTRPTPSGLARHVGGRLNLTGEQR